LFIKKRLNGGLYGQIAYSLSRTEQAARDGVFRRGSFDTPHVLTAVGGYHVGDRWELSSRFTLASGRPYTPPLFTESVEQNRLIYDVTRLNAERLPAFHRLDLRVDRKLRLFGRNASLFAASSDRWTPRSSAAHNSPAFAPAQSRGAMVLAGSGQPSWTRSQRPRFGLGALGERHDAPPSSLSKYPSPAATRNVAGASR
jgi:hypothetical protein